MYTEEQLQQIIAEKIDRHKFIKNPQELYNPVNYILEAGGKRIRPTLVLMGCNLFTENIANAIPAALAYEIFHNFTLLHDDVMDNSPVRRGRATVHKKWNVNTAILSGDAMLIKAYQFISEVPNATLSQNLALFNKTALEVCEGQQMDMNFETRSDVAIDEYLKMIELKTSVLIAACLKCGAMIGGASTTTAELLYDFGINLGMAFQLQDDLLDVYGEQKVFGKKIGGDIIAQKKTYLFLKALKISNPETKKELLSVHSSKIPDEIKIEKVRDIYNKLSIKEITLAKMNAYHKLAVDALEKAGVISDRKTGLYKLAGLIQNRKR